MKIASSQDRIRQIMDEYSINMTEFARRTGLGKAAVSNYLHGYREPKQDQVAKIAETFNVNPAWVLGYDVPRDLTATGKNTLEEQRLLSKFARLKEKDKIEVEKIIDLKLSMSDSEQSD